MQYTILSGPTETMALIAIKCKIYQADGLLFDELYGSTIRPKHRAVVLAKIGKQYVGVVTVTLQGQLMAYVKPAFRSNGMARDMVDHLVLVHGLPRSCYWAVHGDNVEASERF